MATQSCSPEEPARTHAADAVGAATAVASRGSCAINKRAIRVKGKASATAEANATTAVSATTAVNAVVPADGADRIRPVCRRRATTPHGRVHSHNSLSRELL